MAHNFKVGDYIHLEYHNKVLFLDTQEITDYANKNCVEETRVATQEEINKKYVRMESEHVNCPCSQCNGMDDAETVLESRTEEFKVEEKKSLHDRLSELADELEKEGASPILVNEVNQLADDIDSIDSKVVKLQEEIFSEPKEYTNIRLGELSKELY